MCQVLFIGFLAFPNFHAKQDSHVAQSAGDFVNGNVGLNQLQIKCGMYKKCGVDSFCM